MAKEMIERVNQIQSARKKFELSGNGEQVSPSKYIELFDMAMETPDKYMFDDNVSCAYAGIYDADKQKAYFCPLECFTDEEFDYTENKKVKFINEHSSKINTKN